MADARTEKQKVTDFKALQEEREKANIPIEYGDVIVRISMPDSGEYETIKITNMQSEVQNALYDILMREIEGQDANALDYLQENGFEFVPIMRSGGLNDGYPQFYDFDVDMSAWEVHNASELPVMMQAEQLINRMEFHRSVFDTDERNLIMNHAYKLDDMYKTTSLAYSLVEQKDDSALLWETIRVAQEEIDSLPDGMIGLSEMHEYGYSWDEMLPLTKDRASELFGEDVSVYQLHADGSETLVEDKAALQGHDGLFGVEKGDWSAYLEYQSMKQELEDSELNREVQLLYGNESRFGIYQLKDTEETRDIRFMNMNYLEKEGIPVSRENYTLVYTGELMEGMSLEDIYIKFNIDHPADFTGHSLSVSDVVVLHQDGENTSHYVDSVGYREIPEFTKEFSVSAEVSAEKVPESKVIADFKARTEELFNPVNGQTQEDIEQSVYAYLHSKIDEYEMEIELVDMAVSGSRCRGLERAGSDLDVVVEYRGGESEDALFHAFNEDGFTIGGVKVDINPITEGKTGTLAEYLPGVETYLENVRATREKEPRSIFSIRVNDEERFFENTSGLDADALCKAYGECRLPFVEMGKYGRWIDIGEYTEIEQGDRLAFSMQFNEETDQIIIFDGENFDYKGLRETVYPEPKETDIKITLTVAECGEFHNLGEYHEGIASVEEAIAIFNQIPPERMNGIPSIGINIHTEGTERYEDTQMDIVSGRVADLEILDYVPDITDNPKAVEVIAELIDKLPDIEVRGSLEKWQAAFLAIEIDQLSYNYDTVQYNQTVEDREAQIANITEDIRNGNTGYLNDFLNALISESIREGMADIFGKGTEIDDSEGVQTARKAKELSDRLAEYKPLAKVEELEECNYNMIDNILNNEKPKEEKQTGRISVKEKLAEKRAVIEKRDKAERNCPEKDTEKKVHREM